MPLDISTPRGQQTLRDEQIAAQILTENHTRFTYVATPKDGPATVDALLVRDGVEIVGVAETKCRYDMTLADLRTKRGNEWLVTWDKVDRARQVGQGLGVGLWGFLFLTKDRVLLSIQISDSNGLLTQPVRIAATPTQRTVNGGTAVRNNAFISMANAVEMRSGTTP